MSRELLTAVIRLRAVAWIVAAALCACSSPASQGSAAGAIPSFGRFAHHAGGSTPIQHVVIIMQENRSFNNLFLGFPGARTQKMGNGHGTKWTLVPVPLKQLTDINHSHEQFLEDYDQGKSDGWDDEIAHNKTTGPVCQNPVNATNEPSCWIFNNRQAVKQLVFSYVQQSDIKPYWSMAQQYALADNAFASNSGPTYVSHQYMVAGESAHAAEVPNGEPWSCDADQNVTVNLLAYGKADPPAFSKATGHEIPGPFPCFTYPTVVDNLDADQITWRYYAQKSGAGSNLDPFESNKPVWDGPDRANIINPDTKILTDIANGNLAQVSWVTPSGSNSDHPGPQSGNLGPSWVSSVVNAIGESQYWNSTVIVVMWEEWGGFYDPVAPKQYPDPQTGAHEGLGYRVPAIVISPYAKAGYVSHVQHEVTSTLRLIEETFGLPTVGACSNPQTMYADCRADGFDDMLDFTQQPIPFQEIQAPKKARYFLTHLDDTPPDTY
jgi:phospholipase C